MQKDINYHQYAVITILKDVALAYLYMFEHYNPFGNILACPLILQCNGENLVRKDRGKRRGDLKGGGREK